MPISIICQNKDPKPWISALKKVAPSIDVRAWPNDGDKAEVSFALLWQQPPGILQEYPNLKAISSMGAGVDHLLSGDEIPDSLPVARLVDPMLAENMADYVEAAVAAFRFHWQYFMQNQRLVKWSPRVPIDKAQLAVGVMGLGELGSKVAKRLVKCGYSVNGWSKSDKSIASVSSFSGQDSLDDFLRHTQCLINLLPLTPATEGILNKRNLSQLKSDGYLINVGRGKHLVESDLQSELASDKMAGACLDVYDQEPLDRNHWFWQHPKVTMTPHISSLTVPESVAPLIIENYHRALKGEPLLHQVDLSRGY